MTTTDQTPEPDRPSVITASRLLVAAILVGALLSGGALFYAARTDSGQRAENRSNEITGCKSLYFADLQKATTDLIVALGGAVTTDEAAFLTAVEAKDAALIKVDEMGDVYIAEVERSIDDTDAFLADCREKR